MMRHAKSSWDGVTLRDIDRPLIDIGVKNTMLMAKQIMLQSFTPQIIFCSVAKRTCETAKILCNSTGWPETLISIEPDLYTFEESDVLEFIKRMSDDYKRVMILGHNPAFTYLFNSLSGDLITNLPTSGAALLEFKCDHWADITIKHGDTLWKKYPRMFA